MSSPKTSSPVKRSAPKQIRLIGVKQNNLRNVSVDFPFKKLTVVTGVSGSGKSTLVFDTLYAEGQRRYIESLSTYTRQFLEKMPKPDVDHVENIPPAIALEQRNHVVNSRSTVGTQTEVVDYLRVLFAKIGKTTCLKCGGNVRQLDARVLTEQAEKWFHGKKGAILAPLVIEASDKKKKIKFETLLSVVKEQGYLRAVWFGKSKKPVVLDLEEETPDGAGKGEGILYIVVDRFKIDGVDDEMSVRFKDAIEQAIRIGHERVAFFDLDSMDFRAFDCRFACVDCGTEYQRPEPDLFSFNSPLGACSRCSGFGHLLELDEDKVVPDPNKTLKNGAVDPFSKPSLVDWQVEMWRFLERHEISIGKRYRELTVAQKKLLWEGDPKDKKFPGIRGAFAEMGKWKYKLHIRVFIRRYQNQVLCPECKGARLKSESLAVRVDGKSIAEVLRMPITEGLKWISELKLGVNEKKIADEVFAQVHKRLWFMDAVGVGYLTLERLAKTLSGGEFQRINLAAQLGNGLCGTLYVLDEPSIGLHAADTERLINVLKNLRDQGNTVVVVEHDLEVMRAADWLVELGPGAGRRGGELVACGTAKTLEILPGSLTGKYLKKDFEIGQGKGPRPASKKMLKITGCREHNLKNITAEFPLERFVVVTGVSGSGKSTLVHKTLYHAVSSLFERTTNTEGGRYDQLYGADQIRGVVLLDQKPIGRSSRSNPATYLKAWDEVRRVYANQVLALRRGYTPQHFSFNVDGGRCTVCKGEGEITLDMHFMAEVKIPCEECDGKRFKAEVLDVTYNGKNVYELLCTTIDEAYDLFRGNPVLTRKLGILRDVGLGYLQVGQSGATLSGGESQRLKIAAALDSKSMDHLLYVFDEPTTGLHQEDIKKLMGVIQDLVESRNSVIMIEHHMDVIAQADWIIDVGPGGGAKGGKVVAAGSPEQLIREPGSQTGRMLETLGYHFSLPRPEL